jgi:hypothetical protein
MITRLSLIKRGVMVFNAYLKVALNIKPLFGGKCTRDYHLSKKVFMMFNAYLNMPLSEADLEGGVRPP